jgi:hypothetical protein
MAIMDRAPRRSWSDILGTIGIVGPLLTAPAAAQQPQPPPPASTSAQNPPKGDEKSNGDQNRKSQEQEATPKNDRIFWTLPNYLTVENAAHVSPLSAAWLATRGCVASLRVVAPAVLWFVAVNGLQEFIYIAGRKDYGFAADTTNRQIGSRRGHGASGESWNRSKRPTQQ